MNPPPPTPVTLPNHDLDAFSKLPAKTQELELLRDRSEKAIGQEGVAVDQIIRDRSKPGATRAPASAA
jgi:hypothetical protein